MKIKKFNIFFKKYIRKFIFKLKQKKINKIVEINKNIANIGPNMIFPNRLRILKGIPKSLYNGMVAIVIRICITKISNNFSEKK